jgi:Protein of unknown function (DUF2971)
MGPRVSKKRLQVLEKIMKSGELWFSNPLFMNDLEEMRFGIHEGVALFESSDAVDRACNTPQRAHAVKHHLRHYFNQFDNQHAFDVYVFCFSEHLPEKTDGILSMWRGYGGQGNGAALVFNTGFITPRAESPLILSKVHYDSKDNRVKFINEKLNEWCAIVNSAQLQDDQIYLAAYHFFHLIKIFALTFKHDGFREECEWRIIYLPDRDPQGLLKGGFDYVIGSRGVEPKLRFKIAPLQLEPAETWTFASILERIILGPSISSPLAKSSIVRMLEKVGRPEFAPKVSPSSIPLRPL